jgi:hypothetical protein
MYSWMVFGGQDPLFGAHPSALKDGVLSISNTSAANGEAASARPIREASRPRIGRP